MSESLPIPNFQAESSGCSSAQIQELSKLKTFVQSQHNKYTQLKILYDTVQEFVHNSDHLNSELKIKVENICREQDFQQVAVLEDSSLLGLANVASELNYNEMIELKKIVRTVLEKKYDNIYDDFTAVTNENINSITINENKYLSVNSDDVFSMNLKTKLEEQQKKFLDNVLEQQKILEDITKLRLDLSKVYDDKMKECEVKTSVSELQTKIVQEKTRADVFMETSISLSAYEQLLKDIKEQQLEYQGNIEHLKMLKEKYKQVSCKQFDEIMKSYVQYKSSLIKKKMMYESLQKQNVL